MLPVRAKLTRSDQFTACMRARASAKGACVIVYVNLAGSDYVTNRPGCPVATTRGPALGLIVGKNVGNAVARHRLSRRLRAIFAQSSRSDRYPGQMDVVIRALPRAAGATHDELARDVSRQLDRAVDRARKQPSRIRPTGGQR